MRWAKQATGLGALAASGVLAYYGYSLYATRRFEDLDPAAAEATGAILDIDGFRVHYVDTGQGEPVVLIHGWNGSTFSFRHTIPELVGAGYRVVALDLKGYGYSDRAPGEDYSLTAQAEVVRALLDRLGIEQAAVVGHSMGGAVAMRLALRHPQRVERLVLVDSVGVREMRGGVRFGRLLRPLLPLIAPLTLHRPSFRLRALRSAVHDPAFVTPEVAEGYFRPLRVKGHLRSQAGALGARAAEERLDPSGISQPALVLWGEHDRWLPPARGEALARAIPNARFVIVRSAGHLPLEEQPTLGNQEIVPFLGSGEHGGRGRALAGSEAPSA